MINFITDGQGSTESRPTDQRRQRLIEEKELVQDRIGCIEVALYYLGQAEMHLEIDEMARVELVKLGKGKA